MDVQCEHCSARFKLASAARRRWSRNWASPKAAQAVEDLWLAQIASLAACSAKRGPRSAAMNQA